jgi:tellurite resistance protein TehA-like permease
VRALEELDAGGFAVVMATGILGVGARLEGIAVLADALLAAGCAVWLVLALGLGRRSLGSFAVAAGTVVIGADFLLAGEPELALALWSLGAGLWLSVLLLARLRAAASLLSIVATESLAVLAAGLAGRHEAPLLGVAVAAWVLGIACYPLVAGVVLVAAVRTSRFRPDHWILMGALAIATLAGSELLLAARALGAGGQDVLLDCALVTWALASVAIPPLLVAELRTRRWHYDAARWSFVFPLGMYGAASRVLGGADELVALRGLGTVFFWLALAAWLLTAGGLLRRVVRIANT